MGERPAPGGPHAAGGPPGGPVAAPVAHWPDAHRSRAPNPAQVAPTRNRAVDLYRAAAMAVVALGHWLGMVAVLDHDELVVGANLPDFSPEYSWITWIGQVMPLFFFVGGFASATSAPLRRAQGAPPADWVATRLRRMVTPAAALAGFWLVALVVAGPLGGFGIAPMGAVGAAIPLWFLANYTIDTALAPFDVPLVPSPPPRPRGRSPRCSRWRRPPGSPGSRTCPRSTGSSAGSASRSPASPGQDGRLPTGRARRTRRGLLGPRDRRRGPRAVARGHAPPRWPRTTARPTHRRPRCSCSASPYSFTAAALAPAVTSVARALERAWRTDHRRERRRHVRVPVAHDGGRRRSPASPTSSGSLLSVELGTLGLVGDQDPVRAPQPRRPGADRPPRRTDRAAGLLGGTTWWPGPPVDARRGRRAVDQHQVVVEPPPCGLSWSPASPARCAPGASPSPAGPAG